MTRILPSSPNFYGPFSQVTIVVDVIVSLFQVWTSLYIQAHGLEWQLQLTITTDRVLDIIIYS